QPHEAELGELEAADLVRGSVAILHRAQQTQLGVTFTLEVQDHVHQVFQQTRTGDGPVLGDVSDEYGRDTALLGDLDERAGDLADLGDTAGYPRDVGGGHRLDGVHHEKLRGDCVDVADQRGDRGLGRQVEGVGECAEPLCPQPHLARGFLAGDVEDGTRGGAHGGDLQQKGGFADAGLTGEQDHASGDRTAAENPVEFVDAGGDGLGGLHADLGDGAGTRTHGGGGHRSGCGGPGFVNGAPCLTLAAAADPLQ